MNEQTTLPVDDAVANTRLSLTLAEKFLLLIHHPEKSRYLISDQMRNVGLIGALLLDLAYEKKMMVEGDKLSATASNTDLSATHQQVLSRLFAYERPKKIRRSISKLSGKSGKYRHALLASLEEKGLLRIEHKKFLFIPYLSTYLLKHETRDALLREIRGVVFEDQNIQTENAALLGLVEACKMYKLICHDRSETKYCKARLKALVQDDAIAKGVDKVIKAMQAALIASLAATTAATTATTASH